METPVLCRQCFNGATAMKPWKRRKAWTSPRRGRCFNGATAMKPWKSIRQSSSASPRFELQWGHGDEAVEEESWLILVPPARTLRWGHGDEAVEESGNWYSVYYGYMGFNGATAMKPWKRPLRPTMTSSRSSLQWGHGDEAVEEHDAVHLVCALTQLQWGHGDEAVEELHDRAVLATNTKLQWGHGDEAVEES